MKTLHTCKARQLQVGDVLVRGETRWDIIQIEDEPFGLEVRMRNYLGEGRVKFMLPDEIVSIEF
jgi:hypothetical protein